MSSRTSSHSHVAHTHLWPLSHTVSATHTCTLTTTSIKPIRPPAKHAQRLGFSYKPRCVRRPALIRYRRQNSLCLAQWRASHKAQPHSRLFSHSILTARGSISGRKLRQRSQKWRHENDIKLSPDSSRLHKWLLETVFNSAVSSKLSSYSLLNVKALIAVYQGLQVIR